MTHEDPSKGRRALPYSETKLRDPVDDCDMPPPRTDLTRQEDPNKGCDLTCFPPLILDRTGHYTYSFRFVPGAVERALENFPVDDLNAYNKKLRTFHTDEKACRVDYSGFPAQPIRIVQVYTDEYIENQRARGNFSDALSQPLLVIPLWSPGSSTNTEDVRME